MSDEEWRPVVGYEGLYEVSSLGRVKSLPREVKHSHGRTRITKEVIRTGSPMSHGYVGVSLSAPWGRRTETLHRILAEAFLPNPENHPYVRHLNDIKTDNQLENLAWGTPSDNLRDAVRNGTYRNQNTGKEECVRGHPLRGENVYLNDSGGRVCRKCQKMWSSESRDRYASMALAEGDPRHGTPAGYSMYLCRCDDCSEAKRRADRAGTERRRNVTLDEDDPRHGTYSCYKVWSCRCDRCRKANAEYEKLRVRRRKNEQS